MKTTETTQQERKTAKERRLTDMLDKRAGVKVIAEKDLTDEDRQDLADSRAAMEEYRRNPIVPFEILPDTDEA